MFMSRTIHCIDAVIYTRHTVEYTRSMRPYRKVRSMGPRTLDTVQLSWDIWVFHQFLLDMVCIGHSSHQMNMILFHNLGILAPDKRICDHRSRNFEVKLKLCWNKMYHCNRNMLVAYPKIVPRRQAPPFYHPENRLYWWNEVLVVQFLGDIYLCLRCISHMYHTSGSAGYLRLSLVFQGNIYLQDMGKFRCSLTVLLNAREVAVARMTWNYQTKAYSKNFSCNV